MPNRKVVSAMEIASPTEMLRSLKRYGESLVIEGVLGVALSGVEELRLGVWQRADAFFVRGKMPDDEIPGWHMLGLEGSVAALREKQRMVMAVWN